mmetsp:Transcript_4533/g.20356  ORF Transcript_4533/g.20356 Transcript_4533/m.20356 type:complete len:236 (-) Transcript_4533:2290-2997(-)
MRRWRRRVRQAVRHWAERAGCGPTCRRLKPQPQRQPRGRRTRLSGRWQRWLGTRWTGRTREWRACAARVVPDRSSYHRPAPRIRTLSTALSDVFNLIRRYEDTFVVYYCGLAVVPAALSASEASTYSSASFCWYGINSSGVPDKILAGSRNGLVGSTPPPPARAPSAAPPSSAAASSFFSSFSFSTPTFILATAADAFAPDAAFFALSNSSCASSRSLSASSSFFCLFSARAFRA